MQIVDVYDHRLRSLAFRVLGSKELMAEAMQEAYLKAFVALPRFRGEAQVGTWLYRITYTTCINMLAKGQRQPLSHVDDEFLMPVTYDDTVDRFSLRSALAQALASLTPAQRAVVLLVDREDFDYRTAAEILGVPPGTIASRLNSARRALRRRLTDMGVEP